MTPSPPVSLPHPQKNLKKINDNYRMRQKICTFAKTIKFYDFMKIEYEHDYLRQLYEDGVCKDKKHRFQPQVVNKYQKRVDTLIAATCKEDLFPLKSLGFEALHGNKEGLYSVKVDMQYRLEFRLDGNDKNVKLTVCTLTELSNHYK